MAHRHYRRGPGTVPPLPLFLPWSRGSYSSCREGCLPQTAPGSGLTAGGSRLTNRKGTRTYTVPPPGGSRRSSQKPLPPWNLGGHGRADSKDLLKPVSLVLMATLHHR